MNSYFDREVLLQSSIFELRNIARSMGVYSPTIYKKEELINKIFEIVNGEVKPYVPKSKQGRPPKSLSTPNKKSVFDMILPTERHYEMDSQPLPCLSESVRAYLEDDKALVKTSFDIEGILEITSYGYGFVRKMHEVYSTFGGAYVSQNIINSHDLKNGDFIKGRAKSLEDDKPYVLFEISSVNNGEIIKEDFDLGSVTYSLSKLNMSEGIDNFLVGAANIILQDKESREISYDYIKDLDNDISLIYVGIELNREQEFSLKDINGEVYYTTIVSSSSENTGVVKLAIARAKRLASQGKKVVIYIDSIDKVIKNQNLVQNYNLLDIKQSTLDVVKEIAMAARQFENVASLSVVGLYNYKQDSTFDSDIIGELQSYFSKVYRAKK